MGKSSGFSPGSLVMARLIMSRIPKTRIRAVRCWNNEAAIESHSLAQAPRGPRFAQAPPTARITVPLPPHVAQGAPSIRPLPWQSGHTSSPVPIVPGAASSPGLSAAEPVGGVPVFTPSVSVLVICSSLEKTATRLAAGSANRDVRCGARQSRACATWESTPSALEAITSSSPHARAFAALALHHLVALLEQAFAFAVLAFLLLLDVRAFFIGHGRLLPRKSG